MRLSVLPVLDQALWLSRRAHTLASQVAAFPHQGPLPMPSDEKANIAGLLLF